MNVLIAIDSFKGSLTSMQAGNAVKELVYIYRILLSWSIFKKGVIFYDISGFSNYPSE